MKLKAFTTAIVLSVSSFLVAQTTLIRQPKISPDGSKMAFSYHGDIFTYNFKNKQTNRLTLHQAYESHPVWKADGKKLAFASNRKGNTNVFTTSIKGGIPKQLTFYPTTNIPTSWNKNDVIFTTSRVLKGVERDKEIYTVNEQGETPTRVFKAYGDMATMAPNGKWIAFTRKTCRIAREDYSGPANRDIWIYNTQTKTYTEVVATTKNDHSPVWDAQNNLYYISAKDGRYNIYKQAISSGKASGNPIKITRQKTNGVRSFSVSNSGEIVFTAGIDTYKITNGKITKIQLVIPFDNRFDEDEIITTTKGINGFAISPNGKKIAFEVNGEIFVKLKDKEKKRGNNISKHPFKDKEPQFLDDKTLVFLSDRDGKFELFRVASADKNVGLERSLKNNITKILKDDGDISNVIVSPNQKKIAYQVGRAKLMIADIKNGKITNSKVYSNSWAAANGVSWSPDSKWIAYSQQDLNFDSEIFIQSIADKTKKMNVSMHPRSDMSPKWSADGKKLAFLSNRNDINYDVWMVWLQKEDWEKSKADRNEGDYFSEKKEEKLTDTKEKKKPKKKTITVKIDEHKIYDRLVQVTSLSDDEYSLVFSPDSEFIYYSATNPVTKKRGMYKVKWDGSKPKAVKGIGRAGGFEIAKGKIYFSSRGSLKELNPKLDKITAYPHSVTYTKNRKEERAQVFQEGIRTLTDGFYDPEFHGYNWKKLIKKYKPWVLSASTHQDYAYMYNLLLGQLNASHMGYYASGQEKVKSEKIGLLGIEVENVNGGVIVKYVLPNAVSDKSKSKLEVGNMITSVNGIAINKHTNFYSLLKNTQDGEVLLQLQNGKEIVVRPVKSIHSLQYEAWINSRKKLVNKYSNGQLGYIHIQGMNMISFERFERELKASGYGKKGIVIDVRYNGGGWTTDRLMAVLNVDQHAYTVPRGATKSLRNHKKFSKNYPFNERAILSVNTKPVVALCNENSYSNAEIFSHAFKNLGLGKLVGQPTFGAVISTGGKRLSNGFIRMPFRAWYVKKSGKNMENEAPAMPDYLVKNKPGWKLRGEDEQLKKAVEVLLKEI